MFRAKTVLIVGAGASAEFGFPLGGALLADIAKRVDISYDHGSQTRGDHVVANALRSALNANEDVATYNEHLHSAWQLVASSKQGLSIDNVLEALEDDKASKVGKFGIVRSILEAERNSPLNAWNDHSIRQIDFAKFSSTWLGQLTKILTEGIKKSQVSSIFDNISVINFNYDRVIEHYLPYSISNYYGLHPNDVRSIMPSLPVLRPYGKAGTLPWEGQKGSVGFGGSNTQDIELAASQILTFTEQVEDDELVSSIGNVIQSADRIVFLGFGYHRQNLELLTAKCQSHIQICGTSFGISNSDCEVVSDELEEIFNIKDNMVHANHSYSKLHPLGCAEFIAEIWRTLTSGPSEDPTMELPEFPSGPSFGLPSLGIHKDL